MISSPFPYKLTSNSEIKDGVFSEIPKYCLNNQDNHKCKNFYLSLEKGKGIVKCPYGLCADKCDYGGSEIIFTCLNIEHQSDRKEIKRRIKDSEFVPRLSRDRYESLKLAFLNTDSDLTENFKNAQESARVANEKEALSNVIHELKNMINQLTSRADKLSSECQLPYNDFNYIESLSSNVYALTNLMNVRISLYNLEVDPDKSDISEKIEMCIYKKVEKAYKCLQQSINDKHLKVILKGNSYNLFAANSILEIGLFIILENAIKYAPFDSEISVLFTENDDVLIVKFTNWGIKPNSGELQNLTKRGYRGRSVAQCSKLKGRGIGLYLLAIICDMQNVNMHIEVGKETRAFNGDGYLYAPFIVTLKFDGMKNPSDC